MVPNIQIAKITLQTQIFTTVTPVQFCVTKSLPLNVNHTLQYNKLVAIPTWYIHSMGC